MKIRVQRNRGALWISWWHDQKVRGSTLRLGRNSHPLFGERNQGTRGIPVTWHYAFGKRIAYRAGGRS